MVALARGSDLERCSDRGPLRHGRARLAERRRPALGASVAYVHCDLDVLDPGVGRANWLPVPGGLSLDEVTSTIAGIGAAVEVGAAAIASYAPEYDSDGAIAGAALDIADALVAAAAS